MKIFLRSVSAFVLVTITLIVFAFIFLGDEKVRLYALNQVHSYAYSSEAETFSIPLLINTNQSHYFIEEAVSRVQIQSASQEDTVPLELVGFHAEGQMEHDHQTYYYYTVVVRIGLYAEDLVINIADAELVIHYIDSEPLSIPIGEFNYTFEAFHSDHLAMHTRINMAYHFQDMPSSGGLLFSLENKTEESIEIVNITINSNHVKPNMHYLTRYYGEVDSMMPFDEVFSESYNFFQTAHEQHNPIRLDGQEEAYFRIPFAYENDLYALYRYPIVVHYVYQDTLHQLLVDDFMFIRTNPFLTLCDQRHHEVVIDESD